MAIIKDYNENEKEKKSSWLRKMSQGQNKNSEELTFSGLPY